MRSILCTQYGVLKRTKPRPTSLVEVKDCTNIVPDLVLLLLVGGTVIRCRTGPAGTIGDHKSFGGIDGHRN